MTVGLVLGFLLSVKGFVGFVDTCSLLSGPPFLCLEYIIGVLYLCFFLSRINK